MALVDIGIGAFIGVVAGFLWAVEWVTARADVIIRGLRANVSDLQKRLNRSAEWARRQQRAVKRAREQQHLDRVYLDEVKREVRMLLRDDDMPNHWDDCHCSYCVQRRKVGEMVKVDTVHP